MENTRNAFSNLLHRVKSSERRLFLFLVLYRVANSFLLMTIFEPDEIFQNIEPIPFMLRGTNRLTWDWMLGIRSINYVLLYFVPCYLAYRAESMFAAYAAPKIVNGVLSALVDYFTIKTAAFYNVDAFSISVLSHALWLYSPRSHINSFEMLVGISSFYFLEKFRREDKKKEGKVSLKNLRRFALIALYGAFLRPSALLLVFVPFLAHIAQKRAFFQVLRLIPECLAFLGLLIVNDTLFYREPIFVPYNFFKVNILCGVSELFGTQPWFSHFFFALVLLGATLSAFFSRARKFGLLTASVVLFFTFYSLLSHKEMRFILPIVPFCNIVAAKGIKKHRFLQIGTLLVSIYAGMFHQNVSGAIFSLQKRIRELDAENGYSKEIRVFLCVTPYTVPTYPFLANKRVLIRDLGSNPDVFSKIPRPRIYERFKENELTIHENDKFISCLEKNAKQFLDYDFIVLHRPFYERAKKTLQEHFRVVARTRYLPIFYGEKSNTFFYVLERKKRGVRPISMDQKHGRQSTHGLREIEIGGGEPGQGGPETTSPD